MRCVSGGIRVRLLLSAANAKRNTTIRFTLSVLCFTLADRGEQYKNHESHECRCGQKNEHEFLELHEYCFRKRKRVDG